MTVYTGNPFGGFGGFGGGMRNPRMPTPRPMPRPMNRPPINQYQMSPMNQMPRRMPGGPSKGGTTSIPVRPSGGGAPWGGYNPNAGFPGGPGKARNRGQSRGGSWFGGGMPGGPGKGRQTMQPQPFFGNNPPPTAPPPTTGQMGPPSNLQFKMPEPWPIYGNNPPPQPDLTGSGEGGYGGGNIEGGYQQLPIPTRPNFEQLRPGGSNISGPAVPDFGQIRTQGPMNMPPMNFPQPTLRPDQTMGRPMPEPSGFDRGSLGYLDFYKPLKLNQKGNNPPPPPQKTTGELPSLIQGPIRQESMTGNQQPLSGVTGGSFGQLNPTHSAELPERMPPTTPAYWGRSYPGGPVLQTAGLGNMEYTGRGFYGGGITDLYPR